MHLGQALCDNSANHKVEQSYREVAFKINDREIGDKNVIHIIFTFNDSLDLNHLNTDNVGDLWCIRILNWSDLHDHRSIFHGNSLDAYNIVSIWNEKSQRHSEVKNLFKFRNLSDNPFLLNVVKRRTVFEHFAPGFLGDTSESAIKSWDVDVSLHIERPSVDDIRQAVGEVWLFSNLFPSEFRVV